VSVQAATKADLACSFCGKSGELVDVLIAPQDGGGYICDECVDLCNVIISAHRTRPNRDAGGDSTPTE
jgi:ATP-dependent protease Clp ATPase subunit